MTDGDDRTKALSASLEECRCPVCKHVWKVTLYAGIEREHVCPGCGQTMEIYMPQVSELNRKAYLFIKKYGCSLTLEGEAIPLVKELLCRIDELEHKLAHESSNGA